MGGIIKSYRERLKDERGLGLVESVVAVAILGIAMVSFVTALSTGSIAVREGDQETVAQSLAHAQMEYVKSYPYQREAVTYPYAYIYDETYNPDPIILPEGYDIHVAVSSIPEAAATDIQKITVTISREGVDRLTVDNYKVNR